MPPTLRPSLYPLRRTSPTDRLSSPSAISKEKKDGARTSEERAVGLFGATPSPVRAWFSRRVCQESLTQQAHHRQTRRVPCQLRSHRSPGSPWLALWTHGQHCELLNSDDPTLEDLCGPSSRAIGAGALETSAHQRKALQAYPSQTCGHKVNDRFIGQALQRVSLRDPERWEHAGPLPFEQSCTSRLEM